MTRLLLVCFLIVDLGFIAYWVITLVEVVPPRFLFKDYDNPILQAWNWSFLPLDLLVSATGLTAVYRSRSGHSWKQWALLSLALTSCSGLQAIAFWAIRADINFWWWAPNLFLLFYPLPFVWRIVNDMRNPC